MKVWVITAGYDYDAAHCMRVFAEKEAAEVEAKRLKGSPGYDWVDIDEMEVE